MGKPLTFAEFQIKYKSYIDSAPLTTEQIESMTPEQLAKVIVLTTEERAGQGRFYGNLHRFAIKYAYEKKLAQDVAAFKAQAVIAGWTDARSLEIMREIVREAG